MKNSLKFSWLLLLFSFIISSTSYAQGIRKHYTELTEQDRIDYIAAITALDGLGIREDFASLHADPNQDGINGNTAGSGTDSQIHGLNEFLSWHRQFLIEFEWEIQDQAEHLTIPYWDWTGASDPSGVNSTSTVSPLWANNQVAALGWTDDILGSFNSLFSLGRNLGGSLPSATTVNNAINNLSTLNTFRPQLEFPIHGPPHGWVSGQMGNILYSPRDPVFYFHHAMVDKIWQLWEEIPGHNTVFSDNIMPTWDGNVTGFPFVNQNSITDSRDLGIFYTDPIAQLATLEEYSITNDVRPSEKFYYQFDIEAKDNFTIPSGKDAEFRSCNEIVLLPGFIATDGSTFLAKIDSDCDFSTAGLVAGNGDKTKYTTERNEELKTTRQATASIENYPNPFSQLTTIKIDLQEATNVQLDVLDFSGRLITSLINNQVMDSGTHSIDFDGQNLPNGIYLYRLSTNNEILTQKMILSK